MDADGTVLLEQRIRTTRERFSALLSDPRAVGLERLGAHRTNRCHHDATQRGTQGIHIRRHLEEVRHLQRLAPRVRRRHRACARDVELAERGQRLRTARDDGHAAQPVEEPRCRIFRRLGERARADARQQHHGADLAPIERRHQLARRAAVGNLRFAQRGRGRHDVLQMFVDALRAGSPTSGQDGTKTLGELRLVDVDRSHVRAPSYLPKD